MRRTLTASEIVVRGSHVAELTDQFGVLGLQKPNLPFDVLDAAFQVLEISHLAIPICALTARPVSV